MDFKELQSQIKLGKSKEELSRSWAGVMEELRLRRKQGKMERVKAPPPTVPVPASPIPAVEKELAGRSTAADEELARLRQDAAQKAGALSKMEGELASLRQEFAARLVEVDRLGKAQEGLHELEKENLRQSRTIQELESKFKESLARVEELLAKIELRGKESAEVLAQKDRDIAQLRHRLEHYQSGLALRDAEGRARELGVQLEANSRDFQGRIEAFQAEIGAKDEEIEHFRQFISARESELSRRQEEQASEFARQKEAFEERGGVQKARIEELEAEVVSFKRLLIKEEARSRALEVGITDAKRERQFLEERLDMLSGEVREQQLKIGRTLQAVGGRMGESLSAQRHPKESPAYAAAPYDTIDADVAAEAMLAQIEEPAAPGGPGWETPALDVGESLDPGLDLLDL